MTAPRRILPTAQVRDVFELLREQGIDISQCAVDIGSDYVKVSPPANSNAGEGELAQYIDRTPHSPKAPEKG